MSKQNNRSSRDELTASESVASEGDAPVAMQETIAVQKEPAPLALRATTPTQTPPHQTAMTNTQTLLNVQNDLLLLSLSLNHKKPMDGIWQHSLLQLLRNCVESPEHANDFTKNWTAILNFFHQAKGTPMVETHILAPGGNWPGSDTDFAVYRRLVYLITATAEPSMRRNIDRHINLNQATQHLSEEGRNRIISYYY